MSHSKIKPQVIVAKAGMDAGSNRLFNVLSAAIAEKIKSDTGMTVELVGRVMGRGKVSATLIGQMADPAKAEETQAKVAATIDGLKNPSALIDLIR